ncbi:MAG: hypothetical protein IPK08_19925 [Bacteroidetes bacterium]|nr:hypothetical protein [Bacteroidota bacterium]
MNLLIFLNNTPSIPNSSLDNRGGYARVANNYIEACVGKCRLTLTPNTYSYKTGLTAVTQPCEVYLNLIESGNTNTLPMTLNRSATPNRKFYTVD